MSLPVTIGVLSLQGAYKEHLAMFERLPNVRVLEVRDPSALSECDGIVVPGGESTVIGRLAQSSGLLDPLRNWATGNKPMWGTCAGLIMMSDRVEGLSPQRQELLGGLDVTVRRNYFGSQMGSFTADVALEGGEPSKVVFIRAPAILQVGDKVKVLSTVSYKVKSNEAFDQEGKDVAVAVQQGNLVGTSFHPELVADDTRWHEMFVRVVREYKQSQR